MDAQAVVVAAVAAVFVAAAAVALTNWQVGVVELTVELTLVAGVGVALVMYLLLGVFVEHVLLS